MKELTIKNKIGSNFVSSLFITLIVGSVNVVYPLVIGLLYGPEIMGKFSILLYWVSFLSIPIVNGIGPATTRFIAAGKIVDAINIENISSRLTLFYIFLISFIFPILSFTVFNLTIIEFFLIMIILILFMFHYLVRNILQGMENFSYLFKLEVISFGCFLPFMIVLGILPKVLGWDVNSFLYSFFVPIIIFHIACNIIFLISRIKQISLRNFFKFQSITKNILLYALLVGLGSLFGIGTTQIQVIISDKFLSDFELGVLSFWNSAVTPINLLAVTIGTVLLPRITNLRKNETKLELRLVNLANWGLTLIIGPIVGLIFILTSYYINVLEKLTLSKYNMDIYWPVFILLCSQVINSLLANPTVSFFSSSEKNVRINPFISFIFSLSVIVSWIIFVPMYGVFGFVLGMAIGGVMYNLTIQITALIITKGKIGCHIFLNLFYYALNAVFVFLLIEKWSIVGVSIIWSTLAIPAIIFGLLFIFKIFRKDDFSLTYQSSCSNNS